MRDLIMLFVVLAYMFYGAPVAAEFVGGPTAFGAAALLLVTWLVARTVSMIRDR